MENEDLLSNPLDFQISITLLKDIVDKWLQREHGSDDVDMLNDNGGEEWLIQGLKTNVKNGIQSSTIINREKFYGSNRKQEYESKSIWELMWDAFDDLIMKILFVAGIASIGINMWAEADHRNIAWIEGFAILVAVSLVVVVTSINDMKKEKEFQKLNEEAESGKKVTVIRDGQEIDDLHIGDILVGDLIKLKAGNEIPGDGIIVQGYSLTTDESSMTGETKPMKKEKLEICLSKKRELEKNGIEQLDHHDIPSIVLMAGTKILTGTGLMIVINVGKNSSIGKIQEIMTSEDELTPLQLKLEKIARDIGIFGLISALLIFIVLILRLLVEETNDNWDKGASKYIKDILQYFLIAMTILVVAIPEGLPLAVTLSLAVSVGKMMEDQNLVRRLQACETMGGANIICSDKTGTLTKNEMEVTNMWNGKEHIVYDDSTANLIPIQQLIKDQEILQNFIGSNVYNSNEDPNKKDGNPTEQAILRYLKKCNINVIEERGKVEKVFEASFSSDRKRMSTIVKLKDGRHFVMMKGASEYITSVCDNYLDFASGMRTQITNEINIQINEAIQHMATKALRTIGISFKEININEIDYNNKDDREVYQYETSGFSLICIFGIRDTIREEVPQSIRDCHRAGINVKMVTGDNKITARAIAKNVGIINQFNENTALVMEGPEFLRLIGGVVCANCRNKGKCDCVRNENEKKHPGNEKKQIRSDTIDKQEEFDKIWQNLVVLARSRPEDKYALVIGLKERHNVVAVTGDGTNDAPALSKADVGFAMNIAGTEVAKQAADILIMDDNFVSIVKAVKWGRNIYDSIRKFLQFQLTVNIVAVLTTFVSAVILKEPIFSTVQMLWINLIMDTLGALALATEPPDDSLLNRKPYGKNDYIINQIMMKHIIGQSILQVIIVLIFVFAGEKFLFDIMGQRQQSGKGQYLIVSGREASGFEYNTYGDWSVHYTYNFNVFVMLQIFNFINCRIIDNTINIFRGILKSSYFLWIIPTIFLLQIIFLTFCGPAIKVAMWGLDPISWLFCMLIGSFGLIWCIIIKFIPLEKILPGSGKKELPREELDKISSMNIKKKHDSKFFRAQSGIIRNSGLIEDKRLD